MSKDKRKNKIRIPELLAPAGTKEAFIAAVEAGADAIYCGGELFNARMNASNFALPELNEATCFAHKRGVKVHVTLNTLLRDDELPEALDYAKKLRDIGVDALIIQDLGLARLIHESISDFELHMSTQGTIYDLDGVRAAAALGFSRVVLARELSLLDVREIIDGIEREGIKTGGKLVEIETFCHGALCYCYSGQCQMSRAIGGRSGNRGGCAQPCRMLYQSFDAAGHKLEMPYPLSPSDFELIEYLPEIADAGIASIKIEGRMKSPEYVATVVSTYRKYLDKATDSYRVNDADKFALAQIFNRGFTTSNFLDADDELMSGHSPKNRGVFVGRVLSCIPVSPKRKDRFYIDVEVDPDFLELTGSGLFLSNGDVVEIRDSKMNGVQTSSTITFLENQNGHKNKGTVRIGDIKEKVFPGDFVYRIISSEQISSAEKYYKNKDWHSGKFLRKLALEADVTAKRMSAKEEGTITLTLKEPKSGTLVSISNQSDQSEKITGEKNERTAHEGVIKARIENSLMKMGGTPFEVSRIRFHGDFDFSVPMSVLNAMRRDAVAKMEEALTKTSAEPGHEEKEAGLNILMDNKGLAPKRNIDSELEVYFYELIDMLKFYKIGAYQQIKEACETSGVKLKFNLPAAEVASFSDIPSELYESINLYISNVSKGKESRMVDEHLDEIIDFCRTSGAPIYLGNIGQAEKLKGIELRADYGVNIYNRETFEAVRIFGFSDYIESLETDDVHFGAIPLMSIGHESDAVTIIDRKGVSYKLIKPGFSDQIILIKKPDSDIMSEVHSIIKLSAETKTRRRFYIR